jgi:tRNA threonylcarbamoyladenosine biosynthesis protein TsaB
LTDFGSSANLDRMLILGIDTSARDGSIAVANGDSGNFRLVEVVPLTAGAYSAELIPQLTALLERHGKNKSMLQAVAVASGPGSFTGLRIGLSTAKALAEAMGISIAAVSTLEAVAFSASQGREPAAGGMAERPLLTALVLAALDAGRGQIFLGEYHLAGGGAPLCISESLVTMEELVLSSRQRPDATVVTPSQVVFDALEAAGLGARLIAQPKADVIARIGLEKIGRGETVSAELLDANYLRRPDSANLPVHPEISS